MIPSEIRRKFRLSPSDRIEWIVDGDKIQVVPVRENPIEAFRGRGAGGPVKRPLEERAKDRRRE